MFLNPLRVSVARRLNLLEIESAEAHNGNLETSQSPGGSIYSKSCKK